MSMDETMIEVRDARKCFGHGLVLNGLSMRVEKNTIYGLLGPSGCGKTILLRCILGRTALDSGHIKLGIKDRKHVGYMPQEVALFGEFTMKEIFKFYGRLYGLTSSNVIERVKELKNILHLPHWESRIGSLSGGEQRRVSFAVAILHDPTLLILDEPTVGVDAELSHNIWQYLLELTNLGKTIVITTHYVEEAKQAHKIGLMRGGELLKEDTPQKVMASQQSSTLEEAFLKLSIKQKLPPDEIVKKFKKNRSKLPLQNGDLLNWNRFSAQLLKNVCWMKRNTLMMFFLLLLPAMQSFFYSVSFGQNPKSLKMSLVSGELVGNPYCSSTFVPETNEILNCTLSQPYTCHFVQELRNFMDVIIYDNIEDAKESVYKNKVWGVIELNSNFSVSVINRIIEGKFAEDETVNDSSINIVMDMSNYIIANLLRKKILDAYYNLNTILIESCSLPTRVSLPPIMFMDPIFGTMDPVYANSGLPGFYCSFCFYFTMIFTSGAIMMEKLVGLLDRSMVAGMTYLEVISAHLVVQFILMCIQKAIMMFVFYVCYDFPQIGSFLLISLLLFCVEMVGISYGFLLTEVFSCDRLVSYAGIGATLAVFSLGGIIWPIEGAYPIIRDSVWIFPVAPAVFSYNDIAAKGYSLTNRSVYQGFISCIAWTTIFAFITLLIAKSKNSKIL